MEMLNKVKEWAGALANVGVSIFVVAFVCALLVRILQGSATVAMITAAGIVAPLLTDVSQMQRALLVIAIAAGASAMSHVNDSGFWLVTKYLGLSETQTLKSWTVMTSLLALVGFVSVLILSLFV